jgi:hypothetical protein
VPYPNVRFEPVESFRRNLFQNARIAPSIEMYRAAISHHLAAPPRRRGMYDRAAC